MKKTEIKLDSEGVRELLRSEELEAECRKNAEKVRSKIENRRDEYDIDSMVGKNRVNARIFTATTEAYYSNKKHNSLLKASGKCMK